MRELSQGSINRHQRLSTSDLECSWALKVGRSERKMTVRTSILCSTRRQRVEYEMLTGVIGRDLRMDWTQSQNWTMMNETKRRRGNIKGFQISWPEYKRDSTFHSSVRKSPLASRHNMSLQPRQVTFGRSNVYQQQQNTYQAQQQSQSFGLALPGSSNGGSSNLALPGPAANTFKPPQTTPLSQPAPSNSVAGPSTPTATSVPATPAPLTLEQQHITAVEGIVPTLQNIVATVNLDCRLDLKTIALHARNAEYNPKVGTLF